MKDSGFFDDPDVQALLRNAEDVMVPKMKNAAFSMTIWAGEKPNAKFMLEIGAAVIFDKPIVVLALPGESIPPKLRALAFAVIEADPLTEEGKRVSQEQLTTAIQKMIDDGLIEDPGDGPLPG